MRLEDKFFNSFFYLFLIGIFLSLIIVTSILLYFSDDYIDERTASDVITIEKRNAKANLNSMNILLSNLILKLQIAIQEQATLYQIIAKDIANLEFNFSFNKTDVYNPYELQELVNSTDKEIKKRLFYASLWFIDPNIRNINQMTLNMKKQLYTFSTLTQSMYSALKSTNDILTDIFFIFDTTDLFLNYPFTYVHSLNFLETFNNYHDNPSWCTDEQGNKITYYKFKCRNFYKDIIDAQKKTYDLNWDNQKERKVFITPPYSQFGNNSSESVFSICIKFNDPISQNTAYACGDSKDHTLFSSLDIINEKLIGYASIISIGFNEAFYFPQIMNGQYAKTLGEFIYRFDNDYYLEEKTYFLTLIQKYLSSNYIKYINKTKIKEQPMILLDEIHIDNHSGITQRFYVNNLEYNFCLFPIIVENLDKKYEHIFTIVYIYNKKSYYNHLIEYQYESNAQLIFHIILYFFFSCILLYIISLSFKLLAKMIVVPIKNVHYMLEGINVGGEYRLEYLSDLKKKQEDNLEKLNKINHKLLQNNTKKNNNLNIDDLILKENEKNDGKEEPQEKDKSNFQNEQRKLISKNKSSSRKKDKNEDTKEKLNKEEIKINEDSFSRNKKVKTTLQRKNTKYYTNEENLNSSSNDVIEENDNNNNNINLDEEYIDSNINYEKKYDSDVAMIEKELNFYDFDEELLQYRSLEVNNLVQSLINLKGALILTSKSQEVEKIIGYTNSEYTFNNFKNKSGSRMCQSNIGNLQSRLAKYDKAIYHLALSLQNVQLKKFLSSNLTDELDESDSLLHKIEMNYRRDKKEKDINKLVKKQQKGKTVNFSQKIIEILINSRYNKLINIYYKFFSFIQKNNFNYERLSGYFMHTNFHTINFYHKILIQYIYLCFLSNDLVKIGESILDYIEFLIKFKLKYSEENSYIMNINNIEVPEIKEKQLIKRKYFDKIISWINLFDSYAKQINENSSLGNYKNILDEYTHNLQSNHNQFNSGNESASAFLFQINLQRYDFLRGKFALTCKDYSDALGFMINAAKKKRIVIDGLIKKRALKHIAKIANKTRKAVISYNYSKLDFYDTFEKDKFNNKKIKDNNPINNIQQNNSEQEKEIKPLKLIERVSEIIEKINNDINETNEKQLKDIVILIDCNLCTKLVVDSYIDVTKTILKNYLTNNDRIGVFFLLNEYRIICPMAKKEEIDVINFFNELDISSEKIFKKEKYEFSSFGKEEIQKKIKNEGFDSIDDSKQSSLSESGFINSDESIIKQNIRIEDTIKSINYCLTYLKMKEMATNEKFFIYFSSNIKEFMGFLTEMGNRDYLNNLSYESNQKNKTNLQKEKKINFLVVGKFKQENEEEFKLSLVDYFGDKSEVIPFDNMKQIKSILSSNNIINDNIIFPNEVYK